MIISVINHTDGKVSDDELQRVIRAINRQIKEDFEPYWSLGATLRLEGRSETAPSKLSLPDLRGDAILYLWNELDPDGALGYHDQNARGIPYGFVFTKTGLNGPRQGWRECDAESARREQEFAYPGNKYPDAR